MELNRTVAGVRLLAITYLVNAELGHADVQQDLRNLTAGMDALGYCEAQRLRLINEMRAAYATDRGWGVVRAAFDGTLAEPDA